MRFISAMKQGIEIYESTEAINLPTFAGICYYPALLFSDLAIFFPEVLL